MKLFKFCDKLCYVIMNIYQLKNELSGFVVESFKNYSDATNYMQNWLIERIKDHDRGNLKLGLTVTKRLMDKIDEIVTKKFNSKIEFKLDGEENEWLTSDLNPDEYMYDISFKWVDVDYNYEQSVYIYISYDEEQNFFEVDDRYSDFCASYVIERETVK